MHCKKLNVPGIKRALEAYRRASMSLAKERDLIGLLNSSSNLLFLLQNSYTEAEDHQEKIYAETIGVLAPLLEMNDMFRQGGRDQTRVRETYGRVMAAIPGALERLQVLIDDLYDGGEATKEVI